ncbi:Metallo-dependent hydrolase [Gymnopus androsaceus JB14]|uniref:Metallo-dependent hydrolase n=1 Tax=Gymnopus androsaceus JB14 TaxID=1447944 RepID=A0A6A4HZT7_9AGAR|nr:Metallo-dependent hydrolase [Gymnopus androsaceus JB14]
MKKESSLFHSDGMKSMAKAAFYFPRMLLQLGILKLTGIASLCHSHIHLDKCFILERCGDLISGDFKEAMEVTGIAKAAFPSNKEDLMERGRKLVRESVECGVTSMRAHLEIDGLVGFSCLDAGLHLKEEFHSACYIQIAAFAQEALFADAADIDPGHNFRLLAEAVQRSGVEVVGSAPYVEPTVDQAKKNITLILDLATRYSLHADFHLDYNLDPTSEPLIYEVINQARKYGRHWLVLEGGPRITIGHATRLQLFTPAEWRHLIDAIGDLAITIVGLPNSDMYMQGRQHRDNALGAPRSTLRVPYIASKYGFHIAMSVNNVENAFTPQGSVDPLALCSLAAAVFQAATKKDIEILMKGDPADFLIVHGTKTLQQAVLNPGIDRTTIRNGAVVACRQTRRWIASRDSTLTQSRAEIRGWWYALFPISWPYLVYKWVLAPHVWYVLSGYSESRSQ